MKSSKMLVVLFRNVAVSVMIIGALIACFKFPLILTKWKQLSKQISTSLCICIHLNFHEERSG